VPATHSLINGRSDTSVDLDDRGLNYGDGLFETIAVHGGKPMHWQAHMDRLAMGGARLGIHIPERDVLASEATMLCGNVTCGVLKIIITRGAGGRGYAPPNPQQATRILRCGPPPEYPVSYAREGVRVRLCRWRLSRDAQLAGIKHLNRLPQVMARAEWDDEHEEGLMMDDVDAVIEGTKSNLFVVRNNRVSTPDLAYSGVKGVARQIILERAPSIGMPIAIEPLTLAGVREADELFLTNTLIGIWPVRQLEGKTYAVGPVTQAIQKAVVDAFPVLGYL